MNLRFVSGNSGKLAEAVAILRGTGVTVIPLTIDIREIQTRESQKLVEDKVLKAFDKVGRPLFVEHTGLYLEKLGGLPGGLTQVFWDTLQADTFASLFGGSASDSRAIARTVVGYCDGRRIFTFEGETAGHIVPLPRGSRDFQWDCVFQPDGHGETFAEMGTKKNSISMRRIALSKLASHLGGKAP